MLARLILTAAAVAPLGWAVSHAFPAPARPPVPPAKPAAQVLEFQVKLADDSQLSVILLDPSVTVATRYGKLVVPAGDVRRIEPGFRYPAGVEAAVNKALDDLGASEYKLREEAEGALISHGVSAVPGVRRATKSPDPEVANRAAAVLKNLRGKLSADKMDVQDQDVIETAEFTVRGRIEGPELRVRTKHFGEASLPLAEIRSFASVGRRTGGEIALDAAQYAKTNNANWMETSIDVSDGQVLDVTVTGQIDQWPQQPGQYLCNPAGQMTVNGAIQPVRPGQFGANATPGQVVGRLGPTGEPFVIAAAYKGRPPGSGKLYLRIGGSPWGTDSSGTYTVKVSAGGR